MDFIFFNYLKTWKGEKVLKTKASRLWQEDFFLSLIKQNYFKRTVLPVAVFGDE